MNHRMYFFNEIIRVLKYPHSKSVPDGPVKMTCTVTNSSENYKLSTHPTKSLSQVLSKHGTDWELHPSTSRLDTTLTADLRRTYHRVRGPFTKVSGSTFVEFSGSYS